jgi:hypothetical protein
MRNRAYARSRRMSQRNHKESFGNLTSFDALKSIV